MLCYLGTGRRKTAIAQVRLMEGKGIIHINGKPYEEYFPGERLNKAVTAPLTATNTRTEYDITVVAKGGGPYGQASAVALGIARALAKVDRKHHGFRKARRDKQFSKR